MQIAKNVIDEKEKNMESLKQSLETEKQKTAKLEQVWNLILTTYHHKNLNHLHSFAFIAGTC